MSVKPGPLALAPLLALAAACGPAAPPPLPPGSFAFAVFGDGPYLPWENGRFRSVIRDVNRTDLAWFLHVGDLFSHPCSDEHYAERYRQLQSIRHPVVYTPGDNEWTDCHGQGQGGHRPLERLAKLRTVFFADPGESLGTPPMPVETQSEQPVWSEFVENARWVRGGFAFATVHMVGSGNATEAFEGRKIEDDRESARRTAAAIAWLDGTFDLAERDGLHGVVIAMHGDPDFEHGPDERSGYAAFIGRLRDRTLSFGGTVMLIHGDSHERRTDHPLVDPATGDTIRSFTRLETFGSPDIGWVRVVVDSLAGRVTGMESRLMPHWRVW